eukprot:30848-Pelagococcus_subviridis.AAC.1
MAFTTPTRSYGDQCTAARASGSKPRGGERRETRADGKRKSVLEERRPPRERGRTGTSVLRRDAPERVFLAHVRHSASLALSSRALPSARFAAASKASLRRVSTPFAS